MLIHDPKKKITNLKFQFPDILNADDDILSKVLQKSHGISKGKHHANPRGLAAILR